MAKLRRLTGLDVVSILQQFGFTVVRVRGSHHILRRVLKAETQTINVPVHGNKALATGMLKRLYRDIGRYIPEDKLNPHFYSE